MGVLEKYENAIRSDVFARYEKEFAQKINSALAKGYQQKNQREEHLVQLIVNEVNKLCPLKIKNQKTDFGLSTSSIFIHGKKSLVDFNYFEQNVPPIELGDLIFIISVVFKKQKYFERFTITQFKKNRKSNKSISWGIKTGKNDRKQLYLLSRFPTFKGVQGFIPKKSFSLPNYSGCLGSYGLLYWPGDFAFISATELDSFLGHKNGLKKNELYRLTEKYMFPYLRSEFKWYLQWDLFGNYHHAYHAFEFAHKYLSMGIGELVFAKEVIANSQARNFLQDFLSAVEIKAKEEKSEELSEFIKRYRYAGNGGVGDSGEGGEFDFEGGRIGIIHTIINLGE